MIIRRAPMLCACGLLLAAVEACGSASSPDVAFSDPSAAVPAQLAPCTPLAGAATVRASLPDVTLECLGHGPSVHLGSLRGPAVINLWASWCAPCQQETPMLQRAHQNRGTQVRFLGVDTRDLRGAALGFLRAKHVSYQQLSDQQGTLAASLHAPGLPMTVGIDGTGRVVWRKAGQLTASDLRAVLGAVTAGSPP